MARLSILRTSQSTADFSEYALSSVSALFRFKENELRVDLAGQSGRSIVASALHGIKYYFWTVRPAEPILESTPGERPPLDYLARI
nr:hypothetical transcript [Hymenolepis microstoma]